MTGFIADQKSRLVYGRPVAIASSLNGSLFVSDDAGNKIWLVSYVGKHTALN